GTQTTTSCKRACYDYSWCFPVNPPLPDPNPLQVGDTFIATVTLSSASSQAVDTVGMYMTYDHTKVQVNSATALNASFCLVPVSYDNVNGTIAGDCAILGGTPANLDVLRVEFQVLETNTHFDLAFVPCATPTSVNCFGAYSGGSNQIATYLNALGTPLAVTLQTLKATSGTGSLPLIGLAGGVLVLAMAIVPRLWRASR
ncbi:MAG: hypothetical protein KDE45_14105, partial [Caldilineaceae bacterium]|nr:hypothetical protein [Caldilineaceae bacterium]